MLDFLKEHVFETIGLLIMGLLWPVLIYAKNKVTEYWELRKLHPLARSLKVNRAIQTLLIELRAKLDADRVYVSQFHNGQSFTSNNPVWRISRTQEVCGPGIVHEIQNHQNVLASLVWETLLPLVNPNDTFPSGCSKVQVGTDKNSRYYYVFDVNESPLGYFRSSYLEQGVNVVIKAPIIKREGTVIGYVSLNYFDKKFTPTNTDILCDYTDRIYYLLSSHKVD